jgi:hypothetical protein
LGDDELAAVAGGTGADQELMESLGLGQNIVLGIEPGQGTIAAAMVNFTGPTTDYGNPHSLLSLFEAGQSGGSLGLGTGPADPDPQVP